MEGRATKTAEIEEQTTRKLVVVKHPA